MKNITSIKKNILFLSSNPKNTERKRFDEQFREIEDGLRQAKHRDQFEIKSSWAVGVKELRRDVLDYNPQIVHFCGIGEEVGLKFEDDEGTSIHITSEALSEFFSLCKNTVKCVFLNACNSEIEARAIAAHIDYVIGMKREISDQAAIAFAVGFYDAVGSGKSYSEAFSFGRNAIQMFNLPEHDVPVLIEGNHNADDSFTEVAIRTYNTHGGNLDDKKVDYLCCLCQRFNGRRPIQGTWEDIKQEIKSFLSQHIKIGKKYNFYLPLPNSLAFFIGRELPVKAGVKVNIYQSSSPFTLWVLPDILDFKNDPIWNIEEKQLLNTGKEIAIACSVTKNVFSDVEAYVKKNLPEVSRIVHLYLNNIHTSSIKDAHYACEAAFKATDHITEIYKKTEPSQLHFFLSAPNVFAFLLGQQSLGLHNISLYEFEYEINKLGVYFPSITL